MRLGRVALFAALAALILAVRPAAADLRIDITRGVVEPLPIAIVSFQGEGAGAEDVGRNIAKVISADLERSGLFSPIDPKVFIQTQPSVDAQPRFGDWRIINAQALLYGRTKVLDDGRLRVEFRLWDVFSERQMAGLAYFTA
ncbi:MAG: Tol-Pal system protein TolB, partial [Rhodospirillales bacterium]|nr:Tol-Pal system protein TolB [Rhodospirillales bacterium]